MVKATKLIQARIARYEGVLATVWEMIDQSNGKPSAFLIERRAELIAQISVLRQVVSELLEERV